MGFFNRKKDDVTYNVLIYLDSLDEKEEEVSDSDD